MRNTQKHDYVAAWEGPIGILELEVCLPILGLFRGPYSPLDRDPLGGERPDVSRRIKKR